MRGLCYFYLSILTQVSSSTRSVTGFFGHNVTLPCRYDTSSHGVLSFCWGRGVLPKFKCSDTIVSSQDGAVPSSESPRYQLLGRASDGDVSLTILDAQQSDAGLYSCRVEVPGWFNDQKVKIHLVMEEEILPTSVAENEEVVADTSLDKIAEEKFKPFLGMGNISRATAIFLFAIIIMLLLVFRRRFLPKRTLERPQTSPAENIYEAL